MTRVSPEEAERWRERYETGETYEQIANDVGTYPQKVRRLVKAAGGTSRPAAMRKGTVKNMPTSLTGQRASIKTVKDGRTPGARRRRGSRSRIKPR